MALTIQLGELDHADVQQLLALHLAAMHAHSPPHACHVLPAASLDDPAIAFFTAREDGRLVSFGALKALDGQAGEIKSMRTAPNSLRRGGALAILRAIVAEARSRGYQQLLLETGSGEKFAAAIEFYERAGFHPCGPFGGYPETDFTRFMALDL